MPLSQYDDPPRLEDKEAFREYIIKLHSDVYGLGNDTVGTLSVSDNLDINVADISEDITITGTWTFATHPLGLDHLQIANIGSNTHVQIDSHIADGSIHFTVDTIDHALILTSSLLWSNAGHTIDANIVMNDNSMTGVDTITFTDVNGTIAGIQNQNLLDKTATESLSGLYTWTANGIHFNDNIPTTFGNTSGTPDVLIDYDSVTSALNIDLTGVANTDLDVTTSGGANTFFIDGQNTRVGINTNTPLVALDSMGANEGSCFFRSDWTTIPAGLTKNNATYAMYITESGWKDKIMNGFVSSVIYDGFATDNGASINSISGFFNNINLNTTASPGADNHLLTEITGFESRLTVGSVNNKNIEITNYYGIYNNYNYSGSGTISGTNWYGGFFSDTSNANMNPTNLYGLYVEEQTRGNNNFELFIAGGGETYYRDSDIHTGSDVDGQYNMVADNRVKANGRDILSMALMGAT